MRVGFVSEKLQDVLNHGDRLEAEYGPKLARSIRVRLAVLLGARHLGLVPTSPPISLTVIDAKAQTFAVRLVQKRQLLFRSAHEPGAARDLSSIEKVCVLAIR